MLEGKVALVTGASAGIGRATALVMVGHGARIVAVARREEPLRSLVDEIRSSGGDASWIRGDVTVERDVEAMVQFATSEFGRVDCAVNNAGGGSRAPDWQEAELDDYVNVLNDNVSSTWMCMKYEIREMLKQGAGSIVNLSSIAGIRTNFREGYTSAKHAVNGLTYTAAAKYGYRGIRVNAVAPGIIADAGIWPNLLQGDPTLLPAWNGTIPLARTGAAKEVGEAIAWLCADASSYVTGVVLPVDGGTTFTVLTPPQIQPVRT